MNTDRSETIYAVVVFEDVATGRKESDRRAQPLKAAEEDIAMY